MMKAQAMANEKTARGPQDSSRIALGEDYEVQYWPLYIIRTQIHGSGLMSSGMRPSASRSRLSDQI
ncbi:DUF3606 domain-containing protein [Sphingobium fuliginis]|uniref:DUF3606 domain-containing protein n=1 Tax=Sphingobium fuliginis (strain ATCC 27551) TaxID=336203 RepID=UPI00350E5091